jgi:hypothetical protein
MRRKLTVLSATLAVVVWAPAAAQTKPGEPTTPVQPTENQPAASQPAAGTPDEPSAPQSTAPGQAGTTPGQEQTTPGEASQLTPATTGQTPSGQSMPEQTQGQAQAAQVTKATAADIKPGTSVYDSKGNVVGKIASVSSKGAVIDTGSVKATIPTSSFAKGEKGLVFGMTKAELEAAAKKSEPKPAKKPK